MTSPSSEETFAFDPSAFEKRLQEHYRGLLSSFISTCRNMVYFHGVFCLLFFTQVTLFFCSSASYLSLNMAIFLASVFFTGLLYCFLLFFLKERKKEEFEIAVETFLQKSRQSIGTPPSLAEHHISLAHACLRLVDYLDDFEKSLYPGYTSSSWIGTFSQQVSACCHRFDVFVLKELLMKAAIGEHIAQVHVTPVDLEIHTSLATTYILSSKMYLALQEKIEESLFRFFHKKGEEMMAKQARHSMKQALEEYLIINHYVPDDPWVHRQLAKSYRSLSMIEKEILEYETILQLSPQDDQAMVLLGTLYFQQGETAKGLLIYESLKNLNPKKAEIILRHYGKEASCA
ncbi:MAG: hypothetical protein AAGI90_01830 [Chlamydiota bacterium]